jgi:hypothetical protein
MGKARHPHAQRMERLEQGGVIAQRPGILDGQEHHPPPDAAMGAASAALSARAKALGLAATMSWIATARANA